MGTQKINVKNTYVATVKSDIANRAISFYAKDMKKDIFVEESVFPTVTTNLANNISLNDISANQVSNNVGNSETVSSDNNVNIPEELNITGAVNIPINNDAVSEQPIVSGTPDVSAVPPVSTVPNLNKLEILPSEVVTASPMPAVPDVNITPEPIPNPVSQPVAPTPINDNFSNVEAMVNAATVNNNQPITPPRFDASNETNLLGALADNQGQNAIGNINVTPENLNVVREFGVDEPIVTGPNGVPGSNSATGGFINSKILLFVVILLFLASCVFLGYEIYSYFSLTK